jgi:membrane associated rhomboid family serine protease
MFFFPFKDDNPTSSRPIISWALISICSLIFFYQLSLSIFDFNNFVRYFGITPFKLINNTNDQWFTVLSSMFVHGNLTHLAGNMVYLWIFGDNIEDSFGKIRFILFYLLCGVAAVFSQILYDPNSLTPMIGASGAIAGVLGAYLILYPRAKIWVFMWIVFIVRLITVPAFIVLGIWMFLQLINVIDQGTSGVAYSAHIGGFIAGMILAPLLKKKNKRLFAPSTRTKYTLKKISEDDYLKHMPNVGEKSKED